MAPPRPKLGSKSPGAPKHGNIRLETAATAVNESCLIINWMSAITINNQILI